MIITEPNAEIDEAEQYKYPNLACELLTSDLPAMNERLASEEILSKMYCFLQNDPPLNPLLSAYFSRTLSILISRKSEQVRVVYLLFLAACFEPLIAYIITNTAPL